MTNRKNTKRALFSSVISLILCLSMLIGTTFAWFTDSVSSGVNQIVAGNLDVDVYYGDPADKNSIAGVNTLFNDVKLWEPGVVAYENLTVANLGTLALKYNMVIGFDNENNVDGYGLSQILKVGVIDGAVAQNAAREDVLKQVSTWQPMESFNWSGELLAKTVGPTKALVIYWQPTAEDNNWNVNNGKVVSDFAETQKNELHIDLGIELFATQLMHEKDSFDETYDKDTEVFTVAEANAMLKENKDVTLINCIERNGIIQIPAAYTGKLILKDSTIASVQAEAAASVTILGRVTVDASALSDTSAITGTELTITGNGDLTAIANGKHAYGIGGDGTDKITIENIHIVDVKGGLVQPHFEAKWNYGKNEPEGGAAIGSGKDGAQITLNNVTIDNAQGGSKAAGIGANYHTGVTVNITDSIIKNVEGGNASAGIGGSRVERNLGTEQANITKENVVVNIVNSVINATGGDYGAGIGAGYDCDCRTLNMAPMNTVNIDAASQITAQGGWLAAGIGTGHNVVAFTGNIACDTSRVTAGNSEDPSVCCWGNPTTTAENVGLGVLSVVKFPDTLGTYVKNAQELKEQVALGVTSLYLADGVYENIEGCAGKTLTISGSKGAVLKVKHEGEDGCDYDFGSAGSGVGNITFNGLTIDTTANTGNYKGYAYMKGTFNDCSFVGAYSLNNANDFVFNNCEFDFKNGYLWTWSAKSATFNECTFNGNSKNILAHGWESTVININNCSFAATEKGYASGGTVWTSAVEIDPAGSNTYSISIVNSTINENYSAWTRIKDDSTGHTITIDGKPVVQPVAWENIDVATGDVTRENMIAKEYVEICHNGGNMTLENVDFENGLTIYTNNADNNGTITLKGCDIYLNDGNGDPNYSSKTQHKKGYGLNLNLANGSDIKFVFENCTFTAAADYVYDGENSYNVYIGGGYSADSITFTGCTFQGSGKHAIGCSSEGTSQYYTLNVTGCNFKNWNNDPAINSGAAIRGNLPSEDFAANITISGNTFGNSNNSTQKTVQIDSWKGNWS